MDWSRGPSPRETRKKPAELEKALDLFVEPSQFSPRDENFRDAGGYGIGTTATIGASPRLYGEVCICAHRLLTLG